MGAPSPLEFLLNENGASSFVVRGWMEPNAALKLLETLQKEVRWQETEMSLWGKSFKTPRCTAAFGDPDTTQYSYSRLSFPILPWRQDVKEIRDRIWRESHLYFDSCLLNYYRTGTDYVAYHSDREALGERNAVVTVSLGASRRFYFKEKEGGRIIKTVLHNGDCTVMLDRCQELWKHTIPRQAGVDPRISLTFRGINRHMNKV